MSDQPPILSAHVRAMIARLMDACRDAQHGFELASRGIRDPAILRAELLQYSGQWGEFVADLNDALRRAGEPPIESESPIVERDRAIELDVDEDVEFTRLQSAVQIADHAAILAECERIELAVASSYRDLLNHDHMPSNVTGIAAMQLTAIHRVQERLHSLRAVIERDHANPLPKPGPARGGATFRPH